MKFEKITDNKIRIIVNIEDLEKKNINIHSVMSNPIESQNLFVEILDEAEKEIGFSTKGSKISIEAIASSEGDFILTITKFSPEQEKSTAKTKKLNVKRKRHRVDFEKAIYNFSTFEEFCSFCNYIQSRNFSTLKNFAKDTSLYFYNNTYFLVISDINLNYPNLKGFYALISEFATLVNNGDAFASRLAEHGKIIMKKNAIKRCIQYFGTTQE